MTRPRPSTMHAQSGETPWCRRFGGRSYTQKDVTGTFTLKKGSVVGERRLVGKTCKPLKFMHTLRWRDAREGREVAAPRMGEAGHPSPSGDD